MFPLLFTTGQAIEVSIPQQTLPSQVPFPCPQTLIPATPGVCGVENRGSRRQSPAAEQGSAVHSPSSGIIFPSPDLTIFLDRRKVECPHSPQKQTPQVADPTLSGHDEWGRAQVPPETKLPT
jgi:hypothetical protein